jgi:hypothetical protein
LSSNGDSAGSSGARNLRREESGGDRGGYKVCAEIVDRRNLHVHRITRDFRVVPVDGEGDRRVAQHAEIEGVVRVFVSPSQNRTGVKAGSS